MSKINFHCTYTAMTADPLMADATYINVLPSPALAPYIRCFWGSEQDFEPCQIGHI